MAPVDLVYGFDDQPGIIRRRRRDGGFSYRGPDGRPIRDRATLARIKALAIPPAWTDVWISPLPHAHLLATGRDAKGRKQYRYHPRWRAERDRSKYDRMIAFAEALPRIRAAVDSDLARPGLPRPKVLALIARLLEATLIRVGNPEYARANRSFGLTTLRDRHVAVEGMTVTFDFRGKGGKRHRVSLADRRLARIVRNCRDLPGYELFQYVDDDGVRHRIDSADVNGYLRDAAGQDFSAKDVRTWAGTVLAAVALCAMTDWTTGTEATHCIVRAVEHVASRLGNTPAICRKCYVHPTVFEAFRDRSLATAFDAHAPEAAATAALGPEEAAVLRLLRERLAGTAGAVPRNAGSARAVDRTPNGAREASP